MKLTALAVAAVLAAAAPMAHAFEIYKDYTPSKEVWSMTTIKVNPGMGDMYLENLKKTWIDSNEIAKDLGHIEDYAIYWSELPQSGDFNMVLLVKFKDVSQLEPSEARYNAFMKKWSEEQVKNSDETVAKVYPNLRTITGEYMLRKITVK